MDDEWDVQGSQGNVGGGGRTNDSAFQGMDMMWESGNGNDGFTMGELVDRVQTNVSNEMEEEGLNRIGSESGSGTGDLELELEMNLQAPGPVECLQYQDHLLVTGGRGPQTASLCLWNLSTGQLLQVLSQTPEQTSQVPDREAVSCLDFAGGVVLAGYKSLIRVYDISHMIHSKSHVENVNMNATLLAEIASPGTNVTSIKIVGKDETPSTSSTSAQHNPKSIYAVSTCAFGTVSIWKIDTTKTAQPVNVVTCLVSISTVPGILCSHISEAETSSVGRTCWDILCGFKDGNIRGWNVFFTKEPTRARSQIVGDGQEKRGGDDDSGLKVVPMPNTLSSLGDWITCVHADPLADIVAAGSWDGRIRVWDLRQGTLKRTLGSGTGSRTAVLGLSVLGSVMVTGCYDGSLVVHEFGRPYVSN
ncbi:hypothetical protein HDV05_001837 [Chytridiales sp. JEL 0842]|nr:hypothetical protein HDV05_001837 [Chytridiales sp. JEL 0842]